MTTIAEQYWAIQAGRTAVITGAASGIGLAAARALSERGMSIALIDVSIEKLKSAVQSIQPGGGKALAFEADVADRNTLESVAARVAQEMPPVTFLMNNAGIGPSSSTLQAGPEWDKILAVNLWGVINGTHAFAKAMMAHGEAGAIVNTGSKQGITTPPGNPAYNLSKAGVKVFTEALAHELRETKDCKITAHLLIPGWVHTGLTAPENAPRNPATWTPEQTIDFMLTALSARDFYILCPDNETARSLDEKRIAWAAGDIVENRPALSRWHKDFGDKFKQWLGQP